MRNLITTIIIILSFCFGYWVARTYRNTIIKLVPVQAPIPSQREIQQRLTDFDNPRYDPNGVDGVIGRDSRTAWDNLIKDRFAIKAIEGR